MEIDAEYFNCWDVKNAPSPDPVISGWTKLTYTRVTVIPKEWLLNPYSSTVGFLEPSWLSTSFPASLPLPHSNVLAFSVPSLPCLALPAAGLTSSKQSSQITLWR